MDLCTLFWFYKEPEICENRLQLIRKYNPDIKIFGLYGGNIEDEQKYKSLLGSYLDDFYTCPFSDSHYKWIHGDLVLLDWFNQRGKFLSWDSSIVVQWDMLVFDSLREQFQGINENQVYFSGLRELSKLTEYTWWWTTPFLSDNRLEFVKFKNYLEEKFQYKDKILASQFILEVLPRGFYQAYLDLSIRELGMLEYKVPTLAKLLGFSFYNKDLPVMGFGSGLRKTPLTALRPLNLPITISESYIKNELLKDNGWRLFHPYLKKWEI